MYIFVLIKPLLFLPSPHVGGKGASLMRMNINKNKKSPLLEKIPKLIT